MQDPTQPLAVSEIEKQQQNSKRLGTPASWKPGQSGNPNGRPKKDWTWKDLLEEVAEEYIEVRNKQGVSSRHQYKQLVAKKLYAEAIKGNIGAIKELMNRIDGMPKQQNELSGNIEIITHRAPFES